MAGVDPPDLGLPEAVFDALHSMAYNSSAMAFQGPPPTSTLYWLFGEKDGSLYKAKWFHGTATEGAGFPKGDIPEITYNVITGGTFKNGIVTYQGYDYKICLCRDTSGNHLAQAHQV